VLLIAALIADLAGWVYGRAYHDWTPLLIAVPAGLAIVWLHRHDWL
jgi:hypothetical protein